MAARSAKDQKRAVFVGHPYRLFDTRDYRKVFRTVGTEFGVTFMFADEKITGRHIMEKITEYIEDADFSIFDISGWNPNVTLELGLAWGLGRKFFLLLNPTHSKGRDVPSDIKGIDRLEWSSFTALEEELTRLLAQEVGVKPTTDIDKQMDEIRKKTIELLGRKPGLRTEEIAGDLGINSQIIKVIVRGLVEEGRVTTSGQRRGMKYTLTPPARRQATTRPRRATRKLAGAKRSTAKRATAKRATAKRATARRSGGIRSVRRASTARRSFRR